MDMKEESIQPEQKCGEVYFQVEGIFLYNCSYCQAKFVLIEDLQNHFLGQHYIKTEFIDSTKLKNISILSPSSKRRKHRKLSLTSNSSSNFSEDQETPLEDQDFQIEPSSEKISTNIVNNDNQIQENSLQTNASDDIKTIKPINKGIHKTFPCEKCGRIYQRPKKLKAHMDTHKPDFLTCKFCNKTLACKQNLTLHMKLHTGEGYQCSLCPAKFARMANLNIHLKRHSGDKPFSCQYLKCDLRFISNAALKFHELSHTGEKPKVCEYCGRTFKNTNTLNEHVKRHKNQRDFPCSQCDKKFYNKKLLNEHEVGHSGLKNFVCEICSVHFSRRKSLKSHMKKHSGIKSYICNICNASFARYSEHHYHMKSHRDREQ